MSIGLPSDQNAQAVGVENLSLGGVFVLTAGPRPAVGSVVDLVLTLPERLEPIRCSGRIAWHRGAAEDGAEPPGMGVEFLDLSEDSIGLLRGFLANR